MTGLDLERLVLAAGPVGLVVGEQESGREGRDMGRVKSEREGVKSEREGWRERKEGWSERKEGMERKRERERERDLEPMWTEKGEDRGTDEDYGRDVKRFPLRPHFLYRAHCFYSNIAHSARPPPSS